MCNNVSRTGTKIPCERNFSLVSCQHFAMCSVAPFLSVYNLHFLYMYICAFSEWLAGWLKTSCIFIFKYLNMFFSKSAFTLWRFRIWEVQHRYHARIKVIPHISLLSTFPIRSSFWQRNFFFSWSDLIENHSLHLAVAFAPLIWAWRWGATLCALLLFFLNLFWSGTFWSLSWGRGFAIFYFYAFHCIAFGEILVIEASGRHVFFGYLECFPKNLWVLYSGITKCSRLIFECFPVLQ